MSWQIPTFRQFDSATRRRTADKYHITLTELSKHYGPNHYRSDWEDCVVELYEAGASFPTKQWNALPAHLQRRVLRTPRALKMPGNIEPWKVAE
jgi:hypothetical protein